MWGTNSIKGFTTKYIFSCKSAEEPVNALDINNLKNMHESKPLTKVEEKLKSIVGVLKFIDI